MWVLKPIINNVYFRIIVASSLLIPDLPELNTGKFKISLQWSEESKDVYGSFGSGRIQETTTTLDEFEMAFFISGFRIVQTSLDGIFLTVAFAGQLELAEESLIDFAKQALSQNIQFWNDKPWTHYLTAIVAADDGKGITGVNLNNGFSAIVQKSFHDTLAIKSLLTHEIFHTWNPSQLGAQNGNESWFGEGFTDYFANLMLLRGKHISAADYTRVINKTLAQYYHSPYIYSPLPNTDADFSFSDTNKVMLPYLRGQLLALKWAAQLRRKGKSDPSLDAMMRKLLENQRKTRSQILSDNYLIQMLAAEGVTTADEDIQLVVRDGAIIELCGDELGPGLHLEERLPEGPLPAGSAPPQAVPQFVQDERTDRS